MKKKIPVILLILVGIFAIKHTQAQVNDAGLWLNANAEKELSKKVNVALSGELRYNENISELGAGLFDAGLVYKFNKHLKFSANYRFALKRQLNNEYNSYHRYFFDLTYKYNLKPFSFQFRTRFQSAYSEIGNRDGIFASDFYSRNKITVKYGLKKKIDLCGSLELFSPLWNKQNIFRDEARYTFGVEYQINKKQRLDVYYMIQREYEVKNPLTEYIIGLSYNIEF
jgi:long-subunit fatty acid transport protein